MVIVRARVASSQTRFSPTMTLYSTMIPGYCRVQLKKMADLSPGSEVLTPLNRLPVTRSWNWSTWANGDFPHHWPDIWDMGYVLDAPLTGAGGISASGNGRDAIQDGGRKRKWPLPLLGGHQTHSLYYSARAVHGLFTISKPVRGP